MIVNICLLLRLRRSTQDAQHSEGSKELQEQLESAESRLEEAAITPRRSIAVDEQSVPLGAPVYLATSWPNTNKPLSRLMFAQDKGSAIKGAVRADFFWGFGDDAARLAGRMRQSGQMWVLLPSVTRTSSSQGD